MRQKSARLRLQQSDQVGFFDDGFIFRLFCRSEAAFVASTRQFVDTSLDLAIDAELHQLPRQCRSEALTHRVEKPVKDCRFGVPIS